MSHNFDTDIKYVSMTKRRPDGRYGRSVCKKETKKCSRCGHSEVYVKAFNIQCQMEKIK
jgi:hypothetical protein